MNNLHVISAKGMTDVQKAIAWYYVTQYNSKVGLSGQAIVFKDNYYGPNGKWLPLINPDEETWEYELQLWRENGCVIVPIEMHVKMD